MEQVELLKNGTMGVFVGMDKHTKALVWFENEGIVPIGKETWNNNDERVQKIGSICQYPSIVADAITCHKSQGLTLDSVVVHCSTEFVPGLIYVSSSRVRSASHIQMVNFKPSQLLKQPQEVIDICSTALGNPVADISCCRSMNMENDFFNVSDGLVTAFHNNDDLRFPIEELKENVTAYYETPSSLQDPVELILVHDQLNRHVFTLAKPSNDKFNQNKVRSMLLSLKKVDPRAPFAVAKNRLIDALVMEKNFDDIRIFINLLWFQSFRFIEGHLVEDQSEYILEMSRENFTKGTAKLNEFFGSQLYSEMVSCLVEGITSELLPIHRALASQLSVMIYRGFFEHTKEVVKKDREEEPVFFNVGEMGASGKAKVRHVGGWAIKKLLSKARKYVTRNMFSASRETLTTAVTKHITLCEIIEENLVVPYAKLEEHSIYQESLEVTESLQYRNRGLIHISDNAFVFFMGLEQQRVSILNHTKLRKL